MSVEKKEGTTQTCKCGTELICVKIIKEWQGKKEEKLQWQNKSDNKPHFKFAGTGKFDCIIPEKVEIKSSTPPTPDEYLKQRQKEIQEQEIKNKANLEEKLQSLFTDKELELIDKESDRLLWLESFWIKKLTVGGIAPNPNRVGMFVKLLDEKIGESS